MTTGKAVLLAALFGVLVLARGLHVTVRVSPVGSFALVQFMNRDVIDIASGAAAIGETPPPEPDVAFAIEI